MNYRTQEFLNSIEQLPLFSRIGEKDCECYDYAASWMDAMAKAVGSKWVEVLIEASNDFRVSLRSVSPDRFEEFHAVDQEIRPTLLSVCKRVTEALKRDRNLPDRFTNSVWASLLGVAWEYEYSDIVQPGFYTKTILECYRRGHFPCGWKGEFPKGRLIVY